MNAQRSFLRWMLVTLMVAGTFTSAWAQGLAAQATPEDAPPVFATLGLPEIEYTVTNDTIEGSTEVPAGPVLLTVHNETAGWLVSSITRLPEGITGEQFVEVLVNEDALDDWVADAVVAGGFDQAPMTSESAIIRLDAGTWTLGLQGDTELATSYATLTVTESDASFDEASIPVDFVLSMSEYAFDFPDTIPAATRIWQVSNVGQQLHHVAVFPADARYTPDEVLASVQAAFAGTPVATGFSLEVEPVFVSSAISGGQSIWVEGTLDPGFYVALCFMTDFGDATPHLMAGMIDSFEVTET